MKIILSPKRSDITLTVNKQGDIFNFNEGSTDFVDGEDYDFSELPDGATLPEVPCEWIIGPIERIAGELNFTILMPYGPNPSNEVAFPEPLIDPPDGFLVFP